MFKFIFLTVVPHQTHRICTVALNSRIRLNNFKQLSEPMCIFDVFQDIEEFVLLSRLGFPFSNIFRPVTSNEIRLALR